MPTKSGFILKFVSHLTLEFDLLETDRGDDDDVPLLSLKLLRGAHHDFTKSGFRSQGHADLLSLHSARLHARLPKCDSSLRCKNA
eukprot:3590440-Rhodomonas_salina.2